MKASIFTNFTQWVEDKSLILITKEIKEGKFKNEVQAIRELIANGNIEEAEKQKKLLLAFTPSGTFNNRRKADLLTEYSSFVVLDIDKITEHQITNVINTVATIPYTFAAFISPSGNGVKILVAVNNTAEQHKTAYAQIAAFYEAELNIKIDPSGKDVSRLCFMSYDPNCFRNINPNAFQVSLEEKPIQPTLSGVQAIPLETTEESQEDWEPVFGKCLDFTENKSNYSDGNRNNFVHLLACNCNRAGIPQTITENLIIQSHDLDPKEIRQSVESAYKNNTHDFAKFANLANSVNETTPSKDELLSKMPYLPESIFEILPSILKEGANALTDRREKDIFITGALAIISGCMRNVFGLYRGKKNYSNLFIFIIAPAASGKGAITYAKQLGDVFHDKLVNESQAKRKNYDIEMAEYKRSISKQATNLKELEMPTEPPFKVLYIPANNSSARIIQHLKEGDEQGIFCETEADTMGNVFKQDWGSYSDMLRKAFHHEQVSYSRKTNKEWIEIKQPRLSVALAGTPGQVENLIKSAEDGLFSRFIFYTFKSDSLWVDAGETLDGVNLSQHFEDLSQIVMSFVEFLETQETIKFQLTQVQWDNLNAYGKECLNTLSTFVSEDLSSTSKRLGLILFRVAMILTALRYFDNAEINNSFTCSDEDFEIALQIVKVYQEHSVFMFKELPKNATVTDKAMKLFYDALPHKFRRKEAVQIAEEKFNIKSRSADTYLSKLVTFKWLSQARIGYFEKLKK